MVTAHPVRCRLDFLGQVGLFMLALLSLLWLPGSMRADLIFSNFGPNNSYDASDGWTVGAINSTTVQNVAVLFNVGSRAVTLDQIDVAMGLFNSPNMVTLEIRPNVQGVGVGSQVLESFQLLNTLPVFGRDGPALQVDSVLHPLLQANTSYWLEAFSSEPTQAIWNYSVLPFGGSIALEDNNGPWMNFGTDLVPAFAISGTPVPEPATLGLLALGLLSLLVTGCMRKRFK